MNEKKKKKDTGIKKSKDKSKGQRRKNKDIHRQRTTSSSNSSETDEWIEKETVQKAATDREDWMSMTGMIKTYSKEDIKSKREEKDRRHIDSYNPSTSARELNPYWKDGGTGLPQTPESFRKSKPFIKPTDEDFYFSKSRRESKKSTEYHDYPETSKHDKRPEPKNERDSYEQRKSYNWKKSENCVKNVTKQEEKLNPEMELKESLIEIPKPEEKKKDNKYLSDDKMNKLAAKIVKAQIMGNTTLATELKAKLESAREYRKCNPDAGKEDNDGVMLISTNSMGNSRPLTNENTGDPKSKGGKRKVETHVSGERAKYFGNDDKYNLSQMFQQEKYDSGYNDEAEFAKIASKHKNPNDDLEDIFIDEIAKNRNEAKDREIEKQKAINQHVKIEKSLEGCEYCVDSKNMLKHLMVSCGSKVYLAVPAKRSLVKDQCIITTIQHSTCVTSLDEDVWEEIMNYRKALTQFYNSQNKDVVFYETATKLHRYPHMVINCVPMPRDVGDMAAIYFKKALLECEAEWSMNKKVVELKGKNIRRGVPKGLPYFWIDFGMDPGFAHVIEDQQLFPRTFAEEVIAGILDLDHNIWKNPKREYGDLQRKKALDFLKNWKPFEPVNNQVKCMTK